jgi:hypothetical protein
MEANCNKMLVSITSYIIPLTIGILSIGYTYIRCCHARERGGLHGEVIFVPEKALE